MFCITGGMSPVFAQKVAIEFSRELVYEAVPNDFMVVVEGVPCDSLWINTSVGTIKGGHCDYTLNGIRAGILELDVHRLTPTDTIHIKKSMIRVHPFPRPKTTIAGKSNGLISKKLLKKVPGIRSGLCSGSLPCVSYKVTSYKIIVMREDQLIYTEEFKGNKYTKAFKEACNTFQVGDKLYFLEIDAKGPSGKVRTNPVILQIQ